MTTVASPPFEWPAALCFWLVYLLTFYVSEAQVVRYTKQTRGAGPTDAQDPLGLLMFVMLVAKSAALGLAWFGVGIPAAPWPAAMLWAGIALMVAGALLRQHCFRMLGPAFTVEVRADPTQPVIDRGAYRYVRHPSYLAAIFMLFGFGVATGSIWGAMLVTAVALAVFWRRIAFEEKALESALGERYRSYAAGRKRLLPGVY